MSVFSEPSKPRNNDLEKFFATNAEGNFNSFQVSFIKSCP